MGYPNFLTQFALETTSGSGDRPNASFVPDYDSAAALAGDIPALLDHLDMRLTHGTLSAEARDRISSVISLLPAGNDEARQLRARVASVLVMTSPDYIVLR